MAYNILCLIYGFRVLGTLSWDFAVDYEHFCEIRGVLATVLDPNIHLDCWSSACGHQKVSRLRMLYTEHYFGPKAINFGNW